MTKKSHFVSAAIALATLVTASLATAPANAAAILTHIGYYNPAAPVAVNHYGYTRVWRCADTRQNLRRSIRTRWRTIATAFGVLASQ